MLYCSSHLDPEQSEFTIPDIVEASAKTQKRIKPFSRGDVSQILPRLIERGLLYKNRYGQYCFAVPLFERFIKRNYEAPEFQKALFE